jgi:hypothetical protein
MKDFLQKMINEQLKVVRALKAEFVKCGGDLSTLDDRPCPDGHVRDEKGECIPKNDPVDM